MRPATQAAAKFGFKDLSRYFQYLTRSLDVQQLVEDQLLLKIATLLVAYIDWAAFRKGTKKIPCPSIWERKAENVTHLS